MLTVSRHGGVVVWTIDRPSAKNALDGATFDALGGAIRAAAEDGHVRAAVLTGAGEVFVSGGDLRELRGRHAREDAERLTDVGHDVMAALAALPFPVIAALAGPAIGGGAELAIACDLRVADARARIGFKQVRMAVTTAWGSVARLVGLVGAGMASRLLLTAHEIDATAARAIGLVDEVTPNGEALATALAWCAEIERGAPGAVAAMKRLVREASRIDADAVRPLERAAFVETWTAADHIEAVEAYFERRPPRWGG